MSIPSAAEYYSSSNAESSYTPVDPESESSRLSAVSSHSFVVSGPLSSFVRNYSFQFVASTVALGFCFVLFGALSAQVAPDPSPFEVSVAGGMPQAVSTQLELQQQQQQQGNLDETVIPGQAVAEQLSPSMDWQEIQREEPEFAKKICKNWCEKDPPDCFLFKLNRVRTAFQDENCRAALSSTNNANLVGSKIQKLADSSPFVFFRGSAALFYYDLYCAETTLQSKKDVPFVISNGDCHPENFGVMAMAENLLMWGVNDFDHAYNSPFTWDVARGATGFLMACKDRGFENCKPIVQAWLEGYKEIFIKSECKLRNDQLFIEHSKALQHSDAEMIRKAIDKARKRDDPVKARAWLEKYVDTKNEVFHETDELKLLPKSEIPKFQKALETYMFNGVGALIKYPVANDFYKILSIAFKLGSGTGSIGLNRYYLLIKGAKTKWAWDHVILEMKQTADSVLEQYMEAKTSSILNGKRAADSARSANPYANLFYGWTTFKNSSYIIREKHKHKASVGLAELDEAQLKNYAYYSGRAQALFHTHSHCDTQDCNPSSPASIDVEVCNSIKTYIEGSTDFEKLVHQFAEEEYQTEIDAHNILQAEVNKIDNPLDFLNLPSYIKCKE